MHEYTFIAASTRTAWRVLVACTRGDAYGVSCTDSDTRAWPPRVSRDDVGPASRLHLNASTASGIPLSCLRPHLTPYRNEAVHTRNIAPDLRPSHHRFAGATGPVLQQACGPATNQPASTSTTHGRQRARHSIAAFLLRRYAFNISTTAKQRCHTIRCHRQPETNQHLRRLHARHF